jgi:hypothetical protein
MAVIRRSGKKAKVLAAVVGGGAMVALGTISALAGGGSSAGGPAILSVGEMTMGATDTVAYSQTIATSMAVPADKAPPFGGSGG